MRSLRPLLRSHLLMVAISLQCSSRAFHRPLDCQNRTIFKEVRAELAREFYARYFEIPRSHFLIVAMMAGFCGQHFFQAAFLSRSTVYGLDYINDKPTVEFCIHSQKQLVQCSAPIICRFVELLSPGMLLCQIEINLL